MCVCGSFTARSAPIPSPKPSLEKIFVKLIYLYILYLD